MKPLRALLAASALAGLTTCAMADESTAVTMKIPMLNPIAFCRMYASGSGQFSRATYDGCMGREQKAYDRLKATWDKAEPGAKITCLGGKGTDEAYFALEYCIRTESAAINKPAPEFHY